MIPALADRVKNINSVAAFWARNHTSISLRGYDKGLAPVGSVMMSARPGNAFRLGSSRKRSKSISWLIRWRPKAKQNRR